jgi:hypothetical protein
MAGDVFIIYYLLLCAANPNIAMNIKNCQRDEKNEK